MKKIYYCSVLVFCFFVKQSVAQPGQEWEMKKQLLSHIDSFVTVFIQTSELRMPGADHYSDEVADNLQEFIFTGCKGL